MKKDHRLKFMAEMNVSSLADVSFTLMVIFLIAGVSTAFSRLQSIELDLPRASNLTVSPKEGLEVSVRQNGEIYVGRKLTTRAGFPRALGEQWAKGTYDRVFLRSDKKVDYGTIMEVLSMVREQGITAIGLVALPR